MSEMTARSQSLEGHEGEQLRAFQQSTEEWYFSFICEDFTS